jgi:enoyl-CoA hydratase/carnithine racemase
VKQDDNIRVLIITGAGRAFSAGRDVKEVAARVPGEYHPAPPVEDTIEALEKPVIAAVNGYCGTGALEWALACDIIVAADSAVFIDMHARVGLVHGGGGSQRLPRLIGSKRAKEMFFTGLPVPAAEAERIGLINKVVPAEKLEETVTAMAKTMIECSPVSLGIIKGLVNKGLKMDLASGLALETTEYRRYRQRKSTADTVDRLGTNLNKSGDKKGEGNG